jgi:hypothetical protein
MTECARERTDAIEENFLARERSTTDIAHRDNVKRAGSPRRMERQDIVASSD